MRLCAAILRSQLADRRLLVPPAAGLLREDAWERLMAQLLANVASISLDTPTLRVSAPARIRMQLYWADCM